jgi:anti-sigma-K factor RskA
MNCTQVDELAAAYAVGAVDSDEERAISEHLATCARPHAETRDHIGAGAALAATEHAVAPSAGLRDRVMATVAETPQDHRVTERSAPIQAPSRPARASRRPWWQLGPLPTALAAAAFVAAVGLGAWNLSLGGQLAARDGALRAVATADAAYPASGSAGSGWVIESEGEVLFIAESLAALPSDRIYELWLLDAAGGSTPVGTIDDGDGLVVVALERDLGSAAAFAVTVEAGRVDAPTGEPVLIAALGG